MTTTIIKIDWEKFEVSYFDFPERILALNMIKEIAYAAQVSPNDDFEVRIKQAAPDQIIGITMGFTGVTCTPLLTYEIYPV